MRTLFGVALVLLALVVGALWLPDSGTDQRLAVVTEIPARGVAKVMPAGENGDTHTQRTFSPQMPLLPPEPAKVMAGAVRVATPPPAAVNSAHSPVEVVGGASVVTPSAAMAPVRRNEPAPAPALSRTDLVRGLQRELRRVGCYQGDVDGDWGSGSKRAISLFIERANAQLPTDQPDAILLTLLQAQTGAVCSKDCPIGQSFADGGRCVPNAVLASASRRATEASRSRRGREEPPAQVAAAAPEPKRPPSGSWTASVVAAAPQPARPAQTYASLDAPAAPLASPLPSLPGRMSIGGPIDPAAHEHPAPESDARAPARDSRAAAYRGRASGGGWTVTPPRPVVVYHPRPPARTAVASPPPRRYYGGRNWMVGFFDRM